MIEQPLRKDTLREKLREVNGWIDETVRDKLLKIHTDCKFNYMGIILPFEEGDDLNPRMIVNIVANLGLPFNTKKRAPFRIVFETVTLEEIKDKNSNLVQNVQ
jgi:hypothetical protein